MPALARRASCVGDVVGDQRLRAGGPCRCCRGWRRRRPARAGPALREPVQRVGDARGVVVRSVACRRAASTWQSGLPRVSKIAALPVVGRCRGTRGGAAPPRHRVDRDLHVAVGRVLEADRHRQAAASCAVHLALRRPRADRAPADGVRDVLRRDRVEELAAHRQAESTRRRSSSCARCAGPSLTSEAAVQARVVDQTLPADRRARLLEVHAHHDQQIVAASRSAIAASRCA